MTMRALVLQHIACEPPGAYEDVLRERSWELERVELDEGDALPDWQTFGAIIAMGGPMSVNDEQVLPWLRSEKELIANAVEAGRPFFGACLGVQLLASALGAPVYAGPAPEIGLLPVRLTDAARSDPVFSGLPEDLLTFQWHGDTFDLPPGAILLAGSPAYANQAFRVGTYAYGVQFHLEVSPEMAREWADVTEYAASLEAVLGAGAARPLIDELAARADELRVHGRSLFSRWLELAERYDQGYGELDTGWRSPVEKRS
jgi:GMP synthase (glutamine-hydrolysing)